MTAPEILRAHPAPWAHFTRPDGEIIVRDARGQVVELFTLLEFAMRVTHGIAAQQTAPAQKPAAEGVASL